MFHHHHNLSQKEIVEHIVKHRHFHEKQKAHHYAKQLKDASQLSSAEINTLVEYIIEHKHRINEVFAVLLKNGMQVPIENEHYSELLSLALLELSHKKKFDEEFVDNLWAIYGDTFESLPMTLPHVKSSSLVGPVWRNSSFLCIPVFYNNFPLLEKLISKGAHPCKAEGKTAMEFCYDLGAYPFYNKRAQKSKAWFKEKGYCFPKLEFALSTIRDIIKLKQAITEKTLLVNEALENGYCLLELVLMESYLAMLKGEQLDLTNQVEFLLEMQANPNQIKEVAPLNYAVSLADRHLINVLLKYGADPNNISPQTGMPSLFEMYALILRCDITTCAEICEELVMHGADPTKRIKLENRSKEMSFIEFFEELMENPDFMWAWRFAHENRKATVQHLLQRVKAAYSKEIETIKELPQEQPQIVISGNILTKEQVAELFSKSITELLAMAHLLEAEKNLRDAGVETGADFLELEESDIDEMDLKMLHARKLKNLLKHIQIMLKIKADASEQDKVDIEEAYNELKALRAELKTAQSMPQIHRAYSQDSVPDLQKQEESKSHDTAKAVLGVAAGLGSVGLQVATTAAGCAIM